MRITLDHVVRWDGRCDISVEWDERAAHDAKHCVSLYGKDPTTRKTSLVYVANVNSTDRNCRLYHHGGFDPSWSYWAVIARHESKRYCPAQITVSPSNIAATVTDAPTIADWAIDEAKRRTGVQPFPPGGEVARSITQLAIMIERHEQQPIDPVLARAREIANEHIKAVSWFNKGADIGTIAAIMQALREETPR